MTKKEYEKASTKKRLRYRLYRNPLVLFGFGALLLNRRASYFMVKPKERMNILFTFLLIFAVALAASRIMGWYIYFLIQFQVLWLAGGVGISLFYVHHQFEGGVLGTQRRLESFVCSHEGQLVFKIAACVELVFQQHRLPPHSSYRSRDSQLSS